MVLPTDTVDRIHAMPDRFYMAPKHQANRTFVVMGTLTIVVGLLVAVALAVWKFGPGPAGRPAVPSPTPAAGASPVSAATPLQPTPPPPPSSPTPTPEPSPTPSPTPAVQPTSDEDGDGLTLNEERLYTTSPANPDTDADGFPDGAEVRSGYSPRAGEGRTLVVDALFVESATELGFRWSYPISWISEGSSEGGNLSVRLDSRLGEFIVAELQEAADQKALLSRWGSPAVEEFRTGGGVAGYRNADAVPRYFFAHPSSPTKFVVVSFETGGGPPSLGATYGAVVQSFRWER